MTEQQTASPAAHLGCVKAWDQRQASLHSYLKLLAGSQLVTESEDSDELIEAVNLAITLASHADMASVEVVEKLDELLAEVG